MIGTNLGGEDAFIFLNEEEYKILKEEKNIQGTYINRKTNKEGNLEITINQLTKIPGKIYLYRGNNKTVEGIKIQINENYFNSKYKNNKWELKVNEEGDMAFFVNVNNKTSLETVLYKSLLKE